MKKHLGSTIALVLGVLFILAGFANVANRAGKPDANIDFNVGQTISGVIIVLGASAYRSAKKRKLGTVLSTALRQSSEIIVIFLIFAIVLFQKDLASSIQNHPLDNLIIPLWAVIPYFVISSKEILATRRAILLSVISICILLALFIVFRTGFVFKPLATEQDVKYLVKSIDIKKGTFTPGKAENEFQAIMNNYFKELNNNNARFNNEVKELGPIEFLSFDELQEKKQVLFLRSNLKKYWNYRKSYFDRGDELMRKYNKLIGKESSKERLGGGLSYQMQKNEETYVKDLITYYDFIIDNHEKMTFTKENIFMEDTKMVGKLNQLGEKVSKSAKKITKTEKMGKDFLEGIEELKKKE